MDLFAFILKSALIGLISGVIVGFIAKKVSKIAVFMIALVFILLQVAIYNGYVQIDWLAWKDTAINVVKQTKMPTASIKNILLRNLPFSILAIIGFIYGFKKG